MNKEIEKIREEIDEDNIKILNLIKNRNKLARKIGEIKKQEGFEVLDFDREKKIYDHVREQAKELNIDERFAVELFKLIIQNSRELQK